MKCILEFDLPEEREEMNLALKGVDYMSVVWDLNQWLRGIVKYGDDCIPEVEMNVYQKVRDKLFEIAGEKGVEI